MESFNIVQDPAIFGGKPIIKGTRISVDFILERLAAGQTMEDLLEGYPQLTRESLQQAMAFAAREIQRSDVRMFSLPV